jgi:antitoxin MazE
MPEEVPRRARDDGLHLDMLIRRKYSNYMKRRKPHPPVKPSTVIELKVVPIGNSRGVRLPKAMLDRYAIGEAVVLEAREEGLLLRGKKDKRLSWEETFKEMAREREDWRDFDAVVGDGLDKEPW